MNTNKTFIRVILIIRVYFRLEIYLRILRFLGILCVSKVLGQNPSTTPTPKKTLFWWPVEGSRRLEECRGLWA